MTTVKIETDVTVPTKHLVSAKVYLSDAQATPPHAVRVEVTSAGGYVVDALAESMGEDEEYAAMTLLGAAHRRSVEATCVGYDATKLLEAMPDEDKVVVVKK